MNPQRTRSFAIVALLPLLLGACATGNILHQYDYRNRTLAVVSDIPARPDMLSGSVFHMRGSGDPIRDVIRAGARVVREIEADDVQERLDSAALRMDVGHTLEDNTLERAARYLGADAVRDDEEPDFLLEIVVIAYGIDAEGWDAAAHFFIDADATLIHADSGTEIWRAEVGAREQIGPAVFGRRSAVRDLVTATMLSTISVDEMVDVLEALADFSAREVTDRLRDDLRKSRRR